MLLTAVDNDYNLFEVSDVVSPTLLEQILSTDWLNIPYEQKNPRATEHTPTRRFISLQHLPWQQQWHQELTESCKLASELAGVHLGYYSNAVFWLDEPGFGMSCHTDGELSGTMQLYWIGSADTGTTFYQHKNQKQIRKKFEFIDNTGYIMKNQADSTGYRLLQWHAVPVPVPANTFRLSSYIWLVGANNE